MSFRNDVHDPRRIPEIKKYYKYCLQEAARMKKILAEIAGDLTTGLDEPEEPLEEDKNGRMKTMLMRKLD